MPLNLNHIIPESLILVKVLEAANTGIVITDNLLPDNPIIYCNPAFEQISGYTRAEIIGHNCRFLQDQDRNQQARFTIKEALLSGESCVVEIRNYNKQGNLFYNELYISPVKDNAGKITHFIGIQNDVSARKKAEQALEMNYKEVEQKVEERTYMLKQSEEYLSSIVETIRESLLVMDKNYHILSANSHFLHTFKVSLNETKGKLLYDLGNGQWNIPELKTMMEEILPSNNPVLNYEVEHEFPHIGRKLMLLNAHRVELEGQFKDRILLAIEDITERKAIEQRKDDFLSIASHELKTPLTTVIGYMQMIKRMMPENASEKFKTTVNKTSTYVDRLNQLLSELLDVARIQTGNIELHNEPFDFDKMVADAVEGLQTASPGYQITIQGNTGVIFNGDESHLIQVLTNLISNAIKYSPEATQVEIHISMVSNFIKVSVKDYGMGIKEDELKKIFQRFYRVGEIQKSYPGMGIGLYICDQIIKNHGGTLWAESKPGSGSVFSFTLPLDRIVNQVKSYGDNQQQ
ncbi:PAS domain-containing sensor histidine kinase [Pedobacter sp. MC2016-24]|uniref:PAS domain-containing sensor histidine kinase n=1 Tax=Pedobacter sp. MC2016-24 TaxID=2780090 RepID=UPI0018813D83|nr:PAS domain-containing sensor histidine kinase [Pedobacter sp. MC2016-24]MBE9599550.1 PAS domain S-box protein [Pedobacter sp. MC2016-24]